MKKQILTTFVVISFILLSVSYFSLSLFMTSEMEKSVTIASGHSEKVVLEDLQSREDMATSKLSKLSSFVPSSDSSLADWLGDLEKEQALFQEFWVVKLNGEVITKTGIVDGFNARDEGRQYYKDIITNRMEVSLGAPIIDSSGYLTIHAAVPIYRNSQLWGIMGGSIDYNSLMKPKGLDVALTGDDGLVFFGDGVVLSWVGKNVFELRPHYKSLTYSAQPYIYANPKGDWFSVSKVKVRNGFIAWVITQQNPQVKMNSELKTKIMIGSLGLMALLFIGLWLDLNRRLEPISDFVSWIGELSNGNVFVKDIKPTKNELDDITHSLSELSSQLGETLNKVNSSMVAINQRQGESIGVIEVSQANSLNELSSVEQIATASTELSSTARDVADNAQRAEQSAMEANDIIQISQDALKNSTDTTEQISKSISETQAIVSLLREHSDRISSVVDVINNISEQTNLLALNAAIEAARAGEQGRGFAVVADEVRALAGKTQQSTIDIQEIISQLQDQSKQADESMGRNVELMSLTESTTDELTQSFHAISEKVSSISEVNSIVATASEEQSAVTADISNQLENMSVLVKQNIEGVEKSVEANKAVVEVTKELSSELAFFKVDK